MSHISVQGEQSSDDEITALTNLAALAPSGSGQFIRKISAVAFENALAVAAPAGSTGSIQINSSGAFSFDAAFNWNYSTHKLNTNIDMGTFN